MKPFLLLSSLFLALCIISCSKKYETPEKQIQFAFTDVSGGSPAGGRIAAAADPQSVMVTIKDSNGNMAAEKKELTLYKFGTSLLSSPLTLNVSSGSYHLSEFFILGADSKVIYVTPKEGSTMAHLVTDPLDIAFGVDANKITTVTPEVVAVDDKTNAADYGYGQFGFKVNNKIQAVFSSFIIGTSNFVLTQSHIKIEGLSDNSSGNPAVLWTYETDLAAMANTLTIREAAAYRVTATKTGYQTWQKTLLLKDGDKTEIIFQDGAWGYNTVWNKHFGGSSHDMPVQTISTPDGGILTLSQSLSTDHDILNNKGQSDVWILKLNASGITEWSVNYGTAGADVPLSVIGFADGSGYLVTGYAIASDFSKKGWITKIGSAGNVVWEKQTGTSLFSASTLALDQQGFVLVSSVNITGTGTVREIDTNGNTIWDKSTPVWGSSIEIVRSSDSYLVTYQRSIVKISMTGDVQWNVKPFNANGYVDFRVFPQADGYLVFATQNIQPDPTKAATDDIIVAKLDGAGQVKSIKTIETPAGDILGDVIQKPSGNYLLVGSSYAYGSVFNQARIMEVTPEGIVVGQKDFAGGKTYGASFNSIIKSGDEYIVTGFADGAGGDIPGNYGIDDDVWMLRIKF